ncbi:MAG: hypothetical protein ACRECI_10305 [Methyloceanibacter sp.]
MRCDAQTVARLKSMLDEEPFRSFVRPHEADAGPVFTLQEAIIVARKPA